MAGLAPRIACHGPSTTDCFFVIITLRHF